jgi:hypothetical protein
MVEGDKTLTYRYADSIDADTGEVGKVGLCDERVPMTLCKSV